MSILSLTSFFAFGADEMAKRAAVNEPVVADYLRRLERAKTDRRAFEVVVASIKADKEIKAVDIIAIAQRYNGGGKKPSSKTMALAAISKRFVEIVRFHAKNKVAERVRPW